MDNNNNQFNEDPFLEPFDSVNNQSNGQVPPPPPYMEQSFQQRQAEYFSDSSLESPMTIGEWMVTLLILCIPCVNIIMMFVWAFGGSSKKSKSNYFKASLIFTAIVLVLYFIVFAIFGSAMIASFNMLQ